MPSVNSKKSNAKSSKTGVKTLAKSKAAAKKKSVAKNITITVVDEHHHVMKPMWDAASAGKIPKQDGVLLHFDSHPDMGTIGADEEGARRERVQKLTKNIFQNKFDKEECLRLSQISTWVPTLVAQGLVKDVIWVAGWWCQQFRSGSVELLVGRSKKDGLMKIAVPGDRTPSLLQYWGLDDTVEKTYNLVDLKPWTLTVAKFQKSTLALRPEDIQTIKKICNRCKFILDIDEDYLSTQNPFSTEFIQFYGQQTYDHLVELWDAAENDAYTTHLTEIVENDIYVKPKGQYMRDPAVIAAMEALRAEKFSPAKAMTFLSEYRELCHEILPEDEDEDEYIKVQKVQDSDLVCQTGNLNSVPHHISTMYEIIGLLKGTRDLFQKIGKPPGVVTVATSRRDQYIPECQTHTINTMCLDLLTNVWDDTHETRVLRRDYRSHLSIDDEYDPIGDCKGLGLFLTKGRKARMLHRRGD